jgi:hypothetical protein
MLIERNSFLLRRGTEMRSGFSKRRAAVLAAEFILIVAGVLVALALDQWRARLQDRSLEAAYVARLRNDLVSDTASFRWFNGVLDTKDAVLLELLRDRPPDTWDGSPAEHAVRLRLSTFLGLPPVTSATFNELLSTGKVNLLRSGELRGELGEYYAFYSRLTEILDLLPGSYRSIVWSSMPGDTEHALRLDPSNADATAFHEGMAELRAQPALRAAVNHELYYSAGLREYLTAANSRAVALLQRIDALYGS